MIGAVAATLAKLAPVLIVFGVGALFGARKVLAGEAAKAFSDFAFLFAIPAYLFPKLYHANLGALFAPAAVGGYAATAIGTLVLMAAFGKWVVRADASGIALRCMCAVQVNAAYFALPVLDFLFGDASAIFPIVLFQVCVLTVIVLTVLEHGRTDRQAGGVLRAVGSALSTPVVLACAAGVLANLVNFRVPDPLLEGLEFAGAAASPVALFALGLHVGAYGMRWRPVTRDEYLLIAVKCLAFPLLMWASLHYVFGLTGTTLAMFVVIAAMPAPQNAFIYAQRYDGEIDLVAAAVVKSTVLTAALLPLWMLVLAP
ncbi:AEC family transporter [Nocardia sp. NPDC051832]|uniref:AEC family transporter n=1 Tax=Nocardia sp. NPDC051832 TaxID=3155673 RepID=UPI0034340379